MAQPSYVLFATGLGFCLSTSFTIGSLGLTYFAIPAILLPSNAPLIPPLELVAERRKRRFRTETAPKQPLDSGVGDEKETLLDAGATDKVLRRDGSHTGSPSSSSYLLRQWFHLFSKGMHTLPPLTIGSGACYIFCAAMLPNSLQNTLLKRSFYILAALCSVGAMVFTLTVLKPTNSALHERVKQIVAKEATNENVDVDDKRRETEVLIRQWGKLNSARAVLPALAVASAMIGLCL